MKNRIYILTILLAIFCLSINAQTTFQKTFAIGNDDFEGRFVQQTNDGGYITAGRHFNLNTFLWQAFLMKTDNTGTIQWIKAYPDNYSELEAVQQTNDGGFIASGQNAGYNFLLKVSNNGTQIFSISFGALNSLAGSVKQTSDGGIIVSGPSTQGGIGGNSNDDIYLTKFDSNGGLVWDKNYSGNSNDNVNEVIQTSDGGFILVGTTGSFSSSKDILVIKTDNIGNVNWSKTYGMSSDKAGYAIHQTTDGGYILTGSSGYGYELLKLDSNGNISWAKSYNNGSGASIKQTTDGGYFTGGGTGSTGSDAYITKLDASGNVVWSKTYGQTGNMFDEGYCVNQTTDGGFIIAGNADDSVYVSGYSKVYLVKTDSSGNSGCFQNTMNVTVANATFTPNSVSFSITSGINSNSITVNGNSITPSVDNLCFSSGINEFSKNNKFFIYPNPFSSQTTLQTDNVLHNATLAVDNIFGQTVKEIKNISGQTITLHRDNLPSGLYFIRLTQDSKVITADKLVITD